MPLMHTPLRFIFINIVRNFFVFPDLNGSTNPILCASLLKLATDSWSELLSWHVKTDTHSLFN